MNAVNPQDLTGRMLLGGAALWGLAVLVGWMPSMTDRTDGEEILPPTAVVAPALVFDGVTVIDVEQGRRLPAQRVVVRGNRIAAMGNAGAVKLPKGAQVVDAQDKYLIPGLWDMHAHVSHSDRFDNIAVQDSIYRDWYPRFIAHGVTGIREMAQRFRHGADSFRVWQRDVMIGSRVGPRAIGPSADLYALVKYSGASLATAEQVRYVIDSLQAAGDAFVKYHGRSVRRELFFGFMREARRVGLPVVGHLGPVTEAEAVDSGLRSVEHVQGGGTHDCWATAESRDSAAFEKMCAPVAEAYIRNGTWFTPTLTAMVLGPHGYGNRLADILRYVRMMRRLGVTRLLAGSDVGPGRERWTSEFLPGLSAAEELVFLAQAGVPPVEVLQAATLNPAKFLDATDSLGTVAVGKLADLVLLDADPLADITHVLQPRAVVANGRYFDRSALEAFDPEGTKPGRGMLALRQQIMAKIGAEANP